MASSSIKGPGRARSYDGSNLRIAIVHARWNPIIVSALVDGARKSLRAAGVPGANIIVQDVPGSFELPYAVQRIFKASGHHLDAIIAIGVLIKGETMHFEYISDAVTHGLMRLQLDMRVPVIFGVLTVLEEAQALQRAGLGVHPNSGHNHGLDWGNAAVEMAVKTKTTWEDLDSIYMARSE